MCRLGGRRGLRRRLAYRWTGLIQLGQKCLLTIQGGKDQ